MIGNGLGYVDMHLLASAVLTGISFWTLDKRLRETTIRLDLAYTT